MNIVDSRFCSIPQNMPNLSNFTIARHRQISNNQLTNTKAYTNRHVTQTRWHPSMRSTNYGKVHLGFAFLISFAVPLIILYSKHCALTSQIILHTYTQDRAQVSCSPSFIFKIFFRSHDKTNSTFDVTSAINPKTHT